MSDFNPGPQAIQSFQYMFGQNAEISPLGDTGNSHFGYVNPCNVHSRNPGWHVTTPIHGLGQRAPISIHDFFNNG